MESQHVPPPDVRHGSRWIRERDRAERHANDSVASILLGHARWHQRPRSEPITTALFQQNCPRGTNLMSPKAKNITLGVVAVALLGVAAYLIFHNGEPTPPSAAEAKSLE